LGKIVFLSRVTINKDGKEEKEKGSVMKTLLRVSERECHRRQPADFFISLLLGRWYEISIELTVNDRPYHVCDNQLE
jgi:hypothetical protein